MTSPDIEELLQALQAAPQNVSLIQIVLRACLEQADDEHLEEMLDIPGVGERLSDELREQAARLLISSGRLASAAEIVERDSGLALLIEAKQAFAGGDRAGAVDAYRKALATNPTLEDPALAAELSGKVVSLAAARNRAVASIANDDTGADDVVRILQPTQERIAFDDVGGLDSVKQQIRRRIITPFLKPSLFDRFKRRSGGGILMYGPPGCGKTLLARATAGECGAKFYNVAITDVLDMYIGESERKLHEIFELARRTAPAVLFFDEIEALGGKRQHSRESTSAKLVSQFLTELDGFAQANQGVLILGATNVPWALDPAFRRPGRFDRVLFVPPPDQAARFAIVERELDGRPQEGRFDLDEIARRTSGYSGADLRNLVETAVDEAIEQSLQDNRERPLTMDHLREALTQTRATTLEWLTSARNHARYSNQGGQYDEVLEFLNQHGNR